MPAAVTPNYDAVTDGYAECWHGSGVLNHGDYPTGEFQGFRGNRDHRLADKNCCNIDLLADLAEVILNSV